MTNIDTTDRERLAVVESQVRDIRDLLTVHIAQSREQYKELSKHFEAIILMTNAIQEHEKDIGHLARKLDQFDEKVTENRFWISTFKYVGTIIVGLVLFVLQQTLARLL